jgi:CoA:oxalate CoA-transferase
MRTYGPFREYDGMAPAFVAANVGKRSLSLDLKTPRGLEVARRLIASSDVVIENFRPGVMGRLGLCFEDCKTIQPRIVFCSISGYGQSGAQRDYPAIDNIVQATSGMMAANGNPEDPPSRVGWPIVDTYTGTLAALAVLSALLQRERYGTGQFIDVAMLDASVVLLTSLATPYLVTGRKLPRTGDVGYSGAPTAGMFVAQDGARISLGVVQNNQFAALCAAIGRPELIVDERFAEHLSRIKPDNARTLRKLLADVFATRDGAHWERTLSLAGAPCGLVRDIGEVCETVRKNDRGLLQATRIAQAPASSPPPSYVNAGFVFEHDGPGADANAPMLGEHSREVMEALGYSDAQIEELRAAGVVYCADSPPRA